MAAFNPRRACLAALLMVACAAAPAAALSWPLCDNGGAVWVTERPSTSSTFPGSDLWFFCDGGMNILGNPIDPCVNNGTICNVQVANAICSLLGYESAFPDDLTVAPAPRGEGVLALTGDFCLRKGVYSKTVPDNLSSLPGEPCSKIQKITCIRTLDTINAAVQLGLQNARLAALNATPAAEDLPTTARLAEDSAKQAGVVGPTASAAPFAASAAPAQPAAELTPSLLAGGMMGRRLLAA